MKKYNVSDELIFGAAYRTAKTYIKYGLYEKEKPDTFMRNVTSKENFDQAQDHVAQSTVMLENKDNTLPLDASQQGLNFLVIGNASSYDVVVGSGSGAVHTNRSMVMSPLDKLCDELGIERINRFNLKEKKCNEKSKSCIQYFGYTNTNGDGPYEFIRKDNTTFVQKVMGWLKPPPQPPLPPDSDPVYKAKYTHTFIFMGLDSGENGDRINFGWI